MNQIAVLFCVILCVVKADIFKRSIDSSFLPDSANNEINYNFPETIKHKKIKNSDLDSVEIPTDNAYVPIDKNDRMDYKLPDVVKVQKYTVQLKVFLDEEPERKFSFDGIVVIDFELNDHVDNVTFHSAELSIKNVELQRNNYKVKPLIEYYESKTNFLSITIPENKFEPGKYFLSLEYNGTLNHDELGLFKSFYVNEKNESIWFAATNFEPIYARRVFPCFDEPKYKAVFNLSINHHENFSAISNTNVKTISKSDIAGRVDTIFELTPKMSTYNLAFVISDFSKVTNENNNHSLYARSSVIQDGAYVMEIEDEILKIFEQFTGNSLELKKMDLFAIPDNMYYFTTSENWGLVILEEKSLMIGSKLTQDDKIEIVSAIAYGYARQWFGNLITHDDWRDAWLTYGFACYFDFLIFQEVDSSSHSSKNFLIHFWRFWGLIEDSSPDVRPVVYKAESPEEIEEISEGDFIVKAVSIIRMLQHILTEEIFAKGLSMYISVNKYSAVCSDDLYKAMERVMKEENFVLPYNLKSIMSSWLEYEGYPVLHVTRDYTSKTIVINQKRFFAYDASDEEKNAKQLWYVPINIATRVSPDFKNTSAELWLKDFSLNVSVEADAGDWIILNKQQTGFYRINYDELNWKLITKYLKTSDREKIHPLNRAQLMDDALAFYEQNELNIQVLLDLITSLTGEKDLAVWLAGFQIIENLDDKLMNTKYYPQYTKLISTILESILVDIGVDEFENDDFSMKMIRNYVVKQECRINNPMVLKIMQEKLELWLEGSSDDPVEPLIFNCGLRNADAGMWEEVYDKYLNTKDGYVRYHVIEGLTVTVERNALNYLLNESLNFDSEYIDMLDVMEAILDNNPAGVDVILDFITEKLTTILTKFESEELDFILELIGEKIVSDKQLKKLKTLIGKDTPKKVLTNAENNMKWLEVNEEKLKNSLKM